MAAEWTVPVAGNAYRTAPQVGRLPMNREGSLKWRDASDHYTVYFRVDRPSTLQLSLDAKGPGDIKVAVAGKVYPVRLEGSDFQRHPVGSVRVTEPGYVAVAMKGGNGEGGPYGSVRSVVVESDTGDLKLNYVASNKGNMFYWGRRGPSVHLNYDLPRGEQLEYAYSELVVPKGEDNIGSYFMANGFSGGYFGIQVRSPKERWVLFSIWSPYRTDNPNDVPEEDRVRALAIGPDVVDRKFGGEGSGGQSFLVYPWKAGTTYCFLTQVRPDGEGNTVYTGWFAEKGGEWRLIASFQRPKTDTWLRGFHSFLENFNADLGHLGRRSLHGNQWARGADGKWHELTRARFTADGTGGQGHRLDFAGGSKNGYFFMRNGGFFAKPVKPGIWFDREPGGNGPPRIDFDRLPRK